MRILKNGASRYVWMNIQLTKSRVLLFLILFLFAFILSVMKFPYAIFGFIMIPVAYLLLIYSYRKLIEWSSGIKGEEIIMKELKKLDDSYYLISGVVIAPNRGDTDHIVIGRNGIFVIETKNYGGEIECDGDEWRRYKISRQGRKYKLKIGSPSNQVKRNAKALKDLILRHREKIFRRRMPHIWIDSILIFTNENAKLHLRNPTVNVLDVGELCEFIMNRESEFRLDDEEVENIARLILKYGK
ncbi:MAG: hypothetical protein DRO90_01195 [Candidatus Altiarchaeales archaeon]|nr:MAG: hypothetical protein DRO95_00860 [Candidatus Altiarchaeales archaeon]RLI94077.1 MAG: hypothetical protein DRO94_03725 [Candidatus Altiarchaeales archaeon]RLI94936.1 MAG: hypothetical protein DRO90_01195 [Candidatus Altiarchaeales archaeon]HDO82852.1 NERD domain-containing protein [Candidatus Altiarchaeales archaeon]HEX55501.1 NERD domain-containing protein [Candidatus Altiarchaeales archaeon]